MKLQQLRYVLAVSERGSLKNAAEQLGHAQPIMSRSIRELEHELGIDLFDRTHAGMKLTPAGSRFVRRAQAIQAEISRTIRDVNQARGLDDGTLTAGFSTAAHVALMPTMLKPFQLRFPRMRLRIIEGLLPVMEANLRSGVVDLYFGAVSRTFSQGSLEVEPLFDNPRIVIARCGHPLAKATSIADLADASWVTTPVIIDADNEVKTLFESAGMAAPNIAVEAESGMSIITTVASTDLLAPLPQAWRRIIQATGLVQQLPLSDLPKGPSICSVRQPGALLSPAAEYLNRLARRAAQAYCRSEGQRGSPSEGDAFLIRHPFFSP